MITVSNLGMQFGSQCLFQHVDLQFLPGWWRITPERAAVSKSASAGRWAAYCLCAASGTAGDYWKYKAATLPGGCYVCFWKMNTESKPFRKTFPGSISGLSNHFIVHHFIELLVRLHGITGCRIRHRLRWLYFFPTDRIIDEIFFCRFQGLCLRRRLGRLYLFPADRIINISLCRRRSDRIGFSCGLRINGGFRCCLRFHSGGISRHFLPQTFHGVCKAAIDATGTFAAGIYLQAAIAKITGQFHKFTP